MTHIEQSRARVIVVDAFVGQIVNFTAERIKISGKVESRTGQQTAGKAKASAI